MAVGWLQIDANHKSIISITNSRTHLTINDFEATKYYALKAYKANQNNPAVLSIYGQSLLNNGDIKSAIQVFEKLHDLEPITAADSNSDRVIQAKLFAYYADRNINKCDELVDQLETLNSKTAPERRLCDVGEE